MTIGGQERFYVISLLALRRDRRWRAGILQCARSLGCFSQDEYVALMAQIKDPKPRIELRP